MIHPPFSFPSAAVPRDTDGRRRWNSRQRQNCLMGHWIWCVKWKKRETIAVTRGNGRDDLGFVTRMKKTKWPALGSRCSMMQTQIQRREDLYFTTSLVVKADMKDNNIKEPQSNETFLESCLKHHISIEVLKTKSSVPYWLSSSSLVIISPISISL